MKWKTDHIVDVFSSVAGNGLCRGQVMLWCTEDARECDVVDVTTVHAGLDGAVRTASAASCHMENRWTISG